MHRRVCDVECRSHDHSIRAPAAAAQLVLLAASLLLGAGGCAQPRGPAARTSPAPAPSGALRAYRDPASGSFVERPPGASPNALAYPPNAAQTLLAEEAAPGGGRIIRLHGAFHSDVVGHAEARGAAISCATTTLPATIDAARLP